MARVIVVGAGVVGLSCAVRLLEALDAARVTLRVGDERVLRDRARRD